MSSKGLIDGLISAWSQKVHMGITGQTDVYKASRRLRSFRSLIGVPLTRVVFYAFLI